MNAVHKTRASVSTERESLQIRFDELAAKLAAKEAQFAESHDGTHARQADVIRDQLAAARRALEAFEARHAERVVAAGSPEVAELATKARKAAQKFEAALEQAARAAKALQDASNRLADGAHTPLGLWPHRGVVTHAIEARVIDVLGGMGEVRLAGYGTRPSDALTSRYQEDRSWE